MIKIINYGIGNSGSILNMLRSLGFEARITAQPEDLKDASALILPGVGSYDHGVKHLEPFKAVLKQKVLHEKTPLLGICLGMQLLLERSEEGQLAGLGWIRGVARRFDFSSCIDQPRRVIPHMGWSEIKLVRKSDLLSHDEQNSPARFYFVHSFHADQVPAENQIALCHYGYDFTCVIQSKNIFGVQFHPEKSHKFGKQLFKQFISLIKC
jgi:glutamine amidotransferase